MKNVILLIGPKGTGKTYIGTLIERHFGIRFLRVEPIFLENIRTSLLRSIERDAEGFGKVFTRISQILESRDSVIVESTGASDAFHDFLGVLMVKYKTRLISIRTPLKICHERVQNRDNSAHIPVSDDRINEINRKSEAVQLPWDLVFDNSGPASEKSILEHLSPIINEVLGK
ncbi:MAG: hypothetical protein IT289_11520 [Oligoflexia bacterium]|nr:hypothetical protein [Oligoflexia bacterium]